MYATLSVTMYLLWLTLEYGISDWFPTGTMYTFWKQNERKFSGKDTVSVYPQADAFISCCLTILMLISWRGLSIEARDWRKGSMAGSESCPQLISIRIFTFLSNAAVLMASSMNGQNLFNHRTQSERTKQKGWNGLTETNGFLWWVSFTSEAFQSVWWGSTPWRPHRQSFRPLRWWREWPPGPESSMEDRTMVENPGVKCKYGIITPPKTTKTFDS